MKLKKKLATLLLTGALTLSVASSAFALSGWADTQATAITLQPGVSVFQPISDSTDVDWYSWTNNTGSMKSLVLELFSPSGLNYDYDYIMPKHPTIFFQAGDQGPGQVDAAGISGIDPGETIYFRVRGHTPSDFNSRVAYTAHLSVW